MKLKMTKTLFLFICLAFLLKAYVNQQIKIQFRGEEGIPIQIMDNNQEENPNKEAVTTNSFIVNTQSGPIRVTQVSIRRNLNVNRDRQTPIRIIQNVDSYFDNVFNSFIGNMINMQHMQMINHIRDQQRQREELLQLQKTDKGNEQNKTKQEQEEIDTRLDEDISILKEINNTKSNDQNISDNNINKRKRKKTNQTQNKPLISKKAKESISKEKIIEYQEKQKKRQKVFAQICKYVFYLIIFFSFYIVAKKIFQLLDLIDANPKQSETQEDNNTSINSTEMNNNKTREKIQTGKIS